MKILKIKKCVLKIKKNKTKYLENNKSLEISIKNQFSLYILRVNFFRLRKTNLTAVFWAFSRFRAARMEKLTYDTRITLF